MWFFFLPSFIAILLVGFIQVRDELSRHPESAEPERKDAVELATEEYA
jgi:hypothetical protein